ncbi:MAG: hypothetical protein NT154_45315, partial [Verrucomicrobia bacterium]|nr:hypothetical protein [Verrucomicrobiota bacterium]
SLLCHMVPVFLTPAEITLTTCHRQAQVFYFALAVCGYFRRVSPGIRERGSPELSRLYLHLSITVLIDLLQSPLQPLQFRLPFPLQPANDLRHP